MFARHFCRGCPSVPRRLTVVMGGLEPPDFHGVILEAWQESIIPVCQRYSA